MALRSECPALPPGWKREEIIRKSGLSAGKTEVFYFSPDGQKFRSKPQMARYLGRSYDLTAFDFRSGKIVQSALRKSKKSRTGYDYATGMRNDPDLSLPIRQTASIFKQPVTVITGKKKKKKSQQPDNTESAKGAANATKEKPKQLFWERRLGSMHASTPDLDIKMPVDLPNIVQDCGLKLPPEALLWSVAAALHSSSKPITGQLDPPNNIENKPTVRVVPEQPLIKAMEVSQRDIAWQEHRVKETRRRLQQELRSLN